MSTQHLRSIFISWAVVICLPTYAVYGDYRDVTTKVNVNKQTDLFEKSTGDYVSLQHRLEGQKDAGLAAVGSGSGIDWVTKESRGEIEKQAAGLSSIKATELNSRGTQEMVKQNAIDELHVDYSKPLNKQQLVDARQLAKGQDELMRNLLERLQDIGVDCKTVKGAVEQEPTYYLKVEQTKHKDTVYNKTICEELRNTYQCNDSLSLKCLRKGMKWDPWWGRSTTMLYQEIPNHWWSHRRHTDSTYHGRNGHGVSCILRTINPAYHNEVRKSIALKDGVSVDQINVPNQDIVLAHFSHLARNVDFSNCTKNFCFYDPFNAVITFTYEYRDGREICEQWQEDWTERCRLQ